MQVWKTVKIKNDDKQINLAAQSFTNYIFKYGPISNISSKYKISEEDMKVLTTYTSNRIAGLLLLFLAKDIDRINDIANKYNNNQSLTITPEIEGYIEK